MFSHTRLMLIAAAGLLLAGPTLSQEQPADSLGPLLALSDSVQTVVAKALLTKDIPLLRTVLKDEVGILLPGPIPLSAKEATTVYDALLLVTFGGGELKTSRVKTKRMKNAEQYVQELCSFELTRTAADSTVQSWTGHYTAYWFEDKGQWSLYRIFITRR